MSYSRKPSSPTTKQFETFRQKEVERFQNVDRYATSHITGRNNAMVQLLSYLSVLTNSGAIGRDATVDVGGALYQDVHGTRALNQQGAHCLPRQLLINRRDPSDLFANMSAQRDVRGLFGKVTIAPRIFNTADSQAENKAAGLVFAYVHACRHVVKCARQGNAPETKRFRQAGARYGDLQQLDVWPVNQEQVMFAYEKIWFPGARRSYDIAAELIDTATCTEIKGDPSEAVVSLLRQYSDLHCSIPIPLTYDTVSHIERDAGLVGEGKV